MGDAAGLGLDAVREALLSEARTQADALLLRAAERAAAQVEGAEEEKEDLVRRAREEGEAAADAEAAVELARARRAARSLVLHARRELYDDVRREAHEAASAFRSTPQYDRLVELLAARARSELGPEAEVEVSAVEGGVIGSAGNRRVDLTLRALVDRCVDEHAGRLEELGT